MEKNTASSIEFDAGLPHIDGKSSDPRPVIKRKGIAKRPSPGSGLPEVIYVGGVRYEPVFGDVQTEAVKESEFAESAAVEIPAEPEQKQATAEIAAVTPLETEPEVYDFDVEPEEVIPLVAEGPEPVIPEPEPQESYDEPLPDRLVDETEFDTEIEWDQSEAEPKEAVAEVIPAEETDLAYDENPPEVALKMPSRGKVARNIILIFLAFLLLTAAVALTLDFGGKTTYEWVCEYFGIETIPELTAIGDTVRGFFTNEYNVAVEADGEMTEVVSDGTLTVPDLIDLAGLTLGKDDLISLGAETDTEDILTYVPGDGDVVTITRVTYKEYVQEEPIAFESDIIRTPLISAGSSRVLTEGSDGVGNVTYLDTYRDGELYSSEIVSSECIEEPVKEVVLYGDPSASMSFYEGDGSVELNDQGIPSEYLWKLDNAVCTAYNYPAGSYGASGLFLFQGFVAVNPNVIPYGSLLYIVSDNGFTYGWAVAADTGTALLDGRVDIDCFFDYYIESVMFGRHNMDVYVVKQLTQSDLEQYKAHSGMFNLRIPA